MRIGQRRAKTRHDWRSESALILVSPILKESTNCGASNPQFFLITNPKMTAKLLFSLPNLEDLKWINQEEKATLERNLLTSTFKRVIEDEQDFKFLDTQYRMLEPIARFPSHEFYGDKLKTGTRGGCPAGKAFPWPEPHRPLAFIPVTNGTERRGPSGSIQNREEVEAVKKVIDHVLQSGVSFLSL